MVLIMAVQNLISPGLIKTNQPSSYDSALKDLSFHT